MLFIGIMFGIVASMFCHIFRDLSTSFGPLSVKPCLCPPGFVAISMGVRVYKYRRVMPLNVCCVEPRCIGLFFAGDLDVAIKRIHSSACAGLCCNLRVREWALPGFSKENSELMRHLLSRP